MKTYDALVIGGGIAGVSLGYELAADRTVGLLEMESTLAFHTTGRSAATFTESSGGPVMRALTTASRAFLEDPPQVFESKPLSPLPLLVLGPQGAADAVRALHREASVLLPEVRLVEPDEAQQICPVLRPGYVELAMFEPGGMGVDVHCVHQGYTRGLRQRGGEIYTSASVATIERRGGVWRVTDAGGETYQAPVVVDAAGAWCDAVANLARATPVGIQPMRRTIFMLPSPRERITGGLPFIGDIGATFYVKPEGEQFLCSPSEETLQPPSDVRPDELEIARAIDAINTATILNARHVRSSWAGLRSIVPDRLPVVGFDPMAEGFFWFAGQGGYGIQTGPAMARIGAGLVRGLPIPEDVAALGLAADSVSPTRAGLSVAAAH